MNVMIMTDLEGISCVNKMEGMNDANPKEYRYACERLMLDVNAAVEGCLDAGAKNIYVKDGHRHGKNFITELLHEKAVHLQTSSEWQKLIREGKIDAYLEVGCHSMAGTINGFLDHTQSSISWFSYLVNGKPSGEIAQGALFAGAFDVPFVMVSGDEAACVEAKAFLGDIACAVVKYANGRNDARCIPSEEALHLIRQAAAEGLRKKDRIRPYKVSMPLEVKIVYTRSDHYEYVVKNNPNVERLDARTARKIVVKINSYQDILI